MSWDKIIYENKVGNYLLAVYESHTGERISRILEVSVNGVVVSKVIPFNEIGNYSMEFSHLKTNEDVRAFILVHKDKDWVYEKT
jgi:hypothetical protein